MEGFFSERFPGGIYITTTLSPRLSSRSTRPRFHVNIDICIYSNRILIIALFSARARTRFVRHFRDLRGYRGTK